MADPHGLVFYTVYTEDDGAAPHRFETAEQAVLWKAKQDYSDVPDIDLLRGVIVARMVTRGLTDAEITALAKKLAKDAKWEFACITRGDAGAMDGFVDVPDELVTSLESHLWGLLEEHVNDWPSYRAEATKLYYYTREQVTALFLASLEKSMEVE